jgi:pyruvate/2-oxoglutarate dehydrogenase complex dihydrolipoamide acyltransferase (E2) component
MATELLMPQLSMSMTEGELKEWLVEDGADVAPGQAIYAIETEKAVEEVEAPAAGILRRIGVVGETYPVGVKIGLIE